MKQYQQTETPYRLPDGLDVFSWSIPFLAEKVSSMLYTIVSKFSKDDDEPEQVNLDKLIKPDDEKK